ncbi:MAG: T9SS type A sorting domain-containing protein [Bacteroidota bacterium]
MKKIYLSAIFIGLCLLTTANTKKSIEYSIGTPPTDTILWHEFDALPGGAYLLTYPYNNGHGYFFGTNFLDLDQNASTPDQDGIPAFAQGFSCDTAGYDILEVLFLVGRKVQSSDFGTSLIASIHLLDDSTTYNINTSGGPITYTIASPGSSLMAFSVAWDDIKESSAVSPAFTVAHLPAPVEVKQDYAVVVDLFDFYMNGDRIGFMTAGNGSGSAIYGKKYTLWRYPDPLLWLQVSHLYSGIDRSIAIFPVVDDGTTGIARDKFANGLKLGYLYPNPATDQLTVQFETKNTNELELFLVNQQGAVVFDKRIRGFMPGPNQIQLNLQSYPQGIYYLVLRDKEHSLTRKVHVVR